MLPLSEFKSNNIQYLFCDIDDTLTHEGRLLDTSYAALWKLSRHGIKVIPVTGRPAGWCELIARQWPVEAVVGENGAFYFRYHPSQRKMLRHFVYDEATRKKYAEKLLQIKTQILTEIPQAAVASDQFCRLFDLAIDFCEDVKPLSKEQVAKIVRIFESHGAQAKISSIHVNGWFGNHNKLSTCQILAQKEFATELSKNQSAIAFVGDSPNDEPMFEFFDNAFAVANIKEFQDVIKHPPKYVAPKSGADGFAEIAEAILRQR